MIRTRRFVLTLALLAAAVYVSKLDVIAYVVGTPW